METIGQEMFSKQLYLFLCRVIGSKKVVHSRRVFFQIMENSQNLMKSDFKKICSGSKAEGLDMSGSDVDLTIVMEDMFQIFTTSYTAEYEKRNKRALFTDTEHAPPGFVYLRDITNVHTPDNLYTLSDYGMVLSSEKFIDVLLSSSQHVSMLYKAHGPCVQPFLLEFDWACCLKSETWPTIAENWLKRPHNSGWPSFDVLKIVAAEGLLYVPIAKKYGAKKNNPLQWRISFSIQEKLLIYSFNHTQLLCYALLKLILTEFINTKPEVSDLLCSYFLKTTLFWVSEEVRVLEWRPENLFRCFHSCIKRLIYFVKLGYCPNYFIPENNMFEGKIFGKRQTDLLFVLQSLNAGDRIFISKLPTLRHFDPKEDYCNSYVQQNEIHIALYKLFFVYIFFSTSEEPLSSLITQLLTKIRHQSSNLYKSLYFQWLAHFCKNLCILMPYKWQCKNRHFYQQFKEFRFCALIGKNVQTVSGWLLLAIFMYQHGDFYSTLDLTSFILQECTPDRMYIPLKNLLKGIGYDNLSVGNLTFLQKHKICFIHEIFFPCKAETVLSNNDLSLKLFLNDEIDVHVDVIMPTINGPPIVYLHFLRFMCFHRVGNTIERNKCITDIELTIEEEFFISSSEDSLKGYRYLLQASKIANKSKTFIRNIVQKINYIERPLSCQIARDAPIPALIRGQELLNRIAICFMNGI